MDRGRDSLGRRTREALRHLAIGPRRSLGQNFLVDEGVARRIVAAARVDGEVVLEIGPGLGALSELLAREARELVLLEVDPKMTRYLADAFAGAGNVRVVPGDALEVPFDELVPPGDRATVIANLPYSLGSQILIRLLEERKHFRRLVLMLQREVADRLTGAPGTSDYGILTVWTRLYGVPRRLFRVPPRAFVPRPKVGSAVVEVVLQDDPRVALRDARVFRALVKAGFGQRRKTLRRALAALTRPEVITRAGIDPRRRGETLSLEEFAALANAVAASE